MKIKYKIVLGFSVLLVASIYATAGYPNRYASPSGGGSGSLSPTTVPPHNTVQSTLLSGTAYVKGY